ncbi:NAD-dependent histone deacetylase HST3 [Corynascus novoguineensis]|uniref:NAD-dependent histone deacetylase HST3 n=1 Tax=Corynascus novoguineensis TaxID=1126955 RepID=A0AAN7CLD1_9PEZI|nr:NAD-dependent histone deacetylase HST3 [Corynascus novoguineensis]
MIHVGSESHDQLGAIARALCQARRVVVVTGAGISTAAGIPDYRSRNGLYAKGDIFSAAALKNPQRRADIVRSALNLYELAKNILPTESHAFVTLLHNARKLLRCYTQNVDQLHERAGLSTGLGDDVECVPLHGTVDSLRCTSCCEIFEWTEDRKAGIIAGQELPCPRCLDSPRRPGAPPRRPSTIGRLRPNMVYLEEAHPQGEDIAELINRDISACPDMVLVLGTSLKLSGPWGLVRRFARTVSANGGKVIYVNRTKASQRGWDDLFDYWIEWECDSWVQNLTSRGGLFRGAVIGSLPTQPRARTLGGRVSKRPKKRLGKKAKDEPGSSFDDPIILN